MYRLFILIVLALISANVNSQNGKCKESLVMTIASARNDEANQFIRYNNGFIICGSYDSRFIVMFMTEDGEINWSYELDIFPNLKERATNVIIDGDDMVVVGVSDAQNSVFKNFVLKFSITSKTIKWLRVYDGVPFTTSYFSSVLNDNASDSYFVLGQTMFNNGPGLGCDALFLKVNKNTGSVTLAKNVNLGSCESYTSALIASNGFIYGAGRFNFENGGFDKMRGSLTKLDSEGNEIWSKLYTKNVLSDNARLYFQAIASDYDNLIVVGQGDLSGVSATDVDVLLMKSNLDGEIIWHKEIDIQGASGELCTKVVVNNGEYYVLVNALFNGINAYFILKFDTNGNLIWSKKYGRQNNDRGNDIIVTPTNIFVTGLTESPGFDENDILITKTDVDGNGLEENCNILMPSSTLVRNTDVPFQGAFVTEEYNIDFPLENKTITIKPITLTPKEICSVLCADTCRTGVVVHTVPDAELNNIYVHCKGNNTFEISMEICNRDSVTLPGITPFTLYDNNPVTGNAQAIYTSSLGKDVLPFACETFTFMLNLLPAKDYYVMVNDNGTLMPPFNPESEFPNTDIHECDFLNNLNSFMTPGSDSTYVTKTIIDGDSIQVGPQTYYSEGNYIQHQSNIFGCDSTIFIKIKVIHEDLVYDFNNCSAIMGSTNMDYSEFIPSKNSTISCGSINAGNVQRLNPQENKHSCTPGLDNTLAMCVESKLDCDYIPAHQRSVIFTLEITPDDFHNIRLNELRFLEKSPLNYDWINGTSGVNNYPTKFGLRILKNNVEIFRESEIVSLRNWNERKFNFNNIDDFSFNEKSVITFEFLPYCPVGNSSQVSVWDMENIFVYTSCEEKESRRLQGTISQSNGSTFSGATVWKQQNTEIESNITDILGNFSFDDLDINDNCEISVFKNDDFLKGVSTLDLIYIQRHILGMELFQNSSHYVAADINKDTRVSSSDLIELKRLILGKITKFSNNTSWRFCSGIPVFKPSDKIIVNEKYKIGKGNSDLNQLNFTGVKIGDINNEIQINQLQEARNAQVHELVYSFQKVNESEYELTLFSAHEGMFNGLQFALNFNNFEIVDIKGHQLPVDEEDFVLNNNIFTFSKVSPNKVLSGYSKPLMTFLLKPSTGTPNFEGLNSHFSNEFYTKDMTSQSIFLRAKESLTDEGYINVRPNPFDNGTTVEYYSTSGSVAQLEVYSMTGNLVYKKSDNTGPGRNFFEITSDQLMHKSGLYLVRILTENQAYTAKIVLK